VQLELLGGAREIGRSALLVNDRLLLEFGMATGSAEFDGRRMPVSATVERYDFSAHADRHGLRSFLDDYRDARLLVTHGDRFEWFAERLAGTATRRARPTSAGR
jgi:Cft2 family RNA processing exonuclease